MTAPEPSPARPNLFEPPADDEPRLPPDEVRARIAALKAQLEQGGDG